MLVDLYVNELWSLALSVKSHCESVFTLAKSSDATGGHYLAIKPDVHKIIASCLADAANFKKLIYTASSRQKAESDKVFKLRQYRAKMLREALQGVSLDELLSAKVRNTIQHFDEYLDQAVVALSDVKSRKSPWAGYNLVVSTLSVCDPPVHPIRVYVADDRTYYNFRWSVNMQRLHDEASSAAEKLSKHQSVHGLPEPGGAILRF